MRDLDVLRARARLVERGEVAHLRALAAEVGAALGLDPLPELKTIRAARDRLRARGRWPWPDPTRWADHEGRSRARVDLLAELARQRDAGADVVSLAEAARRLGLDRAAVHSRYQRLSDAYKSAYPTRLNRDRRETVGSIEERREIERRIEEARRARRASSARRGAYGTRAAGP